MRSLRQRALVMIVDPASPPPNAAAENVEQAPLAADKPGQKYFVGSWKVGEFEFILSETKFASCKTVDHEGSFGEWTYFDDPNGKSYLMLTLSAIFPQFAYSPQYIGSGQQGANKVEFPKKMALSIKSFQQNQFHCVYKSIPMVFDRAHAIPAPLLEVRIEELKSMLAIEETAFASKMANWNQQFGLAADLQSDLWKQINSWKLS
jgi:hypothetical protein